MSGLLEPRPPPSRFKHTADDFENHFWYKVDTIRNATQNLIQPRATLDVFLSTTPCDVSLIIISSPVKQCLSDPAPTWLVKRLCPVLSGAIAIICNASFVEGVLPPSQKHAIVTPRLRKPTLDPDDLNSYRPISSLSFLSKTIERVVAVPFNEHVEAYNLLTSHQSAYRAHHSTETAKIDVHNRIVSNMDRGRHASVLVLLDLSSAFDTVDHAIFLEVLEKRFVFIVIALKWYCLCRWTDADVPGRFTTFHHVRRPLHHTSGLSP